MGKLRYIFMTMIGLLILLSAPMAQAKTVLYIPADDRPVSLEYSVDTVKAAKMDILTPPVEYLASRGRLGDPEKLWQWLIENCKQADAIVVSADSLVYGGLVDSRTHDFESYVLDWRMRRFNHLNEVNPHARVYVFSTIMRTPQASVGGVEPPYYETYGPNIFLMTALQDKEEVQGLTKNEQKVLKSAIAAIPKEALEDWEKRRVKNLKINEQLIDATKKGLFSYLIIGRDDTSPFSQSHKESRLLTKVASGLSASKFNSFPGADQLGMIMLVRAYNDLTMQIPIVQVEYAMGAGGATVPSYEDQPFATTINQHIIAAGGIVMTKPQKPDIVLAVNTPLNGITLEAESISNISAPTEGTRQFVNSIAAFLKQGKRVAVADIAFANGADNSLMKELSDRRLLMGLSSYSGWNTASNTLGYTIGQGMMARDMSDSDRKQLLAVRYLDDWAYQANIRRELYYEVIYPQNGSLTNISSLEPGLTQKASEKVKMFAQRNLLDIPPDKIKVSFPWNRMFELTVVVEN